jgi:hypothetical protein
MIASCYQFPSADIASLGFDGYSRGLAISQHLVAVQHIALGKGCATRETELLQIAAALSCNYALLTLSTYKLLFDLPSP